MSDIEFEEPQKGISRRTVTKAMAWAVPVIAVALPSRPSRVAGGIIEIQRRSVASCPETRRPSTRATSSA